MIIDRDEDRSRCFYHFLLLMFIQYFQQPIQDYLWIVVTKKVVALTVKNQPYEGINKNPVIDMVSADSAIEPMRVCF